MKIIHYLVITTLLLLLVFGLNGCMPAVHLNTPELEKARTPLGSVAIGEINNLRPKGAGENDFGVIGEIRRGYGSATTLRAAEDREIDIAVREALRNSLDHAGYFALTPAVPGDIPHLDVDVLRFWSESYRGYRIETMLVVRLMEPGSRKVLAQREINISRDFAATGARGSLPRAFDTVMSALQKEFVDFMLSEPFRVAVRRS
jgi:hypothetical protein